MEGQIQRWFWILGRVFGGVVGLVTFIGCWVAAVQQWGWLLGLAFGWVPAAIIGTAAGVIAWLAWAPLWVAGALALCWWVLWGQYQ